MVVIHSVILVSSLWRVFPITLSSQADMPSLTTVTLNRRYAFKYKKTVHIKSSSSSSPSFLDITPALQQYLSFPLSFTHTHPFSIVANEMEPMCRMTTHLLSTNNTNHYLLSNEECNNLIQRKENDVKEQHSTTKERERSEACTELNGFHAVSKHSGKESKPKDGIDCIPKHCSHQNNKRG